MTDTTTEPTTTVDLTGDDIRTLRRGLNEYLSYLARICDGNPLAADTNIMQERLARIDRCADTLRDAAHRLSPNPERTQ